MCCCPGWAGEKGRVKWKNHSAQSGAASCRYRLAVPGCQHLGKLQLRGLLSSSGVSSRTSLVPVVAQMSLKAVISDSSAGCLLWGATVGSLAQAGYFFKPWYSRTWRPRAVPLPQSKHPRVNENCETMWRGFAWSGNKGDKTLDNIKILIHGFI